MNTDGPQYDIVWPQSPRSGEQRTLAPRLDSLAGKRIAFVWEFLFRGDELFPVLERELRARYPDVEIVGYDVFGNTHGPDEAQVVAALPGALHERHVDAVISGNGC